ncbi:MAG: endo-1,4-beta-xylanase [Lachnospiraceae bacterium]|nr:endo-1,4-beta-xylanase [Lachnospiraceae bacterium]
MKNISYTIKRMIISALVLALTTSGCAQTAGNTPGAAGNAPESENETAGPDEQGAEQAAGEKAEAAGDTGIPEIMPAEKAEASGDGKTDVSGAHETLPLKELFADDFKMGVAVQAIDHWNDPTAEIGNPDKEELIKREFNSMTFGNEWKPAYNFDSTSPTLYKTDPAAEELLTWAKKNGIPVRGHTLVWHSQCNPNIFAKDFKAVSNGSPTTDWNAKLDPDCLVDSSTLVKRLRTYIRGVMEYTYSAGFADTVYAFDVINEASEEKNADGLRESYYYQIIGPDFLYYCFLFAREAELDYAKEYAALYGLDAETDDLSSIMPKLFYNDYNEWFPARSAAIRRFISEDVYNEDQKLIKSDAIAKDGDGTIAGDGLIDGIGMQGHLDDTQNIDQYIRALHAYSEIVDEVHITELDVGETASGDFAEQKQAAFVNEFFRRLLKAKEEGAKLTSVTWWGLTDDASWRRGANPLLYHGDLSEKPAYEALQLAARGEEYDASNPPSLRDSSDMIFDFEPKMVDGTLTNHKPEDLGFYSRGSGHQSALRFVNDDNHTEGAPIGRCLKVTREESDATVRLDISRFIGETINISIWVKTADSAVTLGVSGDSDTVLSTTAQTGDWVEIKGACRLNEGLQSASLFIETDGNSDILVDDVYVTTGN